MYISVLGATAIDPEALQLGFWNLPRLRKRTNTAAGLALARDITLASNRTDAEVNHLS